MSAEWISLVIGLLVLFVNCLQYLGRNQYNVSLTELKLELSKDMANLRSELSLLKEGIMGKVGSEYVTKDHFNAEMKLLHARVAKRRRPQG